MITGFNTDIKHGSRVFHVQTEDKGMENPFVESLVYVGGEIIASKKTPYTDSIKNGGGSAGVQEMMEAASTLRPASRRSPSRTNPSKRSFRASPPLPRTSRRERSSSSGRPRPTRRRSTR